MIDVCKEELFPLSLIAAELPNRKGGKGVNVCTVWRWALKGLRGQRLCTVMAGGIRMCSREAVARFFAAVTAAADGQALPLSQPGHLLDRNIATAEASLSEEGF